MTTTLNAPQAAPRATNRRITRDMTPEQKRQAVEEMLREIAYVLHVTRKIARTTPA